MRRFSFARNARKLCARAVEPPLVERDYPGLNLWGWRLRCWLRQGGAALILVFAIFVAAIGAAKAHADGDILRVLRQFGRQFVRNCKNISADLGDVARVSFVLKNVPISRNAVDENRPSIENLIQRQRTNAEWVICITPSEASFLKHYIFERVSLGFSRASKSVFEMSSRGCAVIAQFNVDEPQPLLVVSDEGFRSDQVHVNAGALLALAGVFGRDNGVVNGLIGAFKNTSLIKHCNGGQDYENKRGQFAPRTSTILSMFLFSIGLFFVSVRVYKSRDTGYYPFLVLLAWPLRLVAIWLFLLGVLGWHSLALSDSGPKDIRVQSVILAELELGDIERQVLFADFVESSDHAALDQRPEALNRVRVDGADAVLTVGVVDRKEKGVRAAA